MAPPVVFKAHAGVDPWGVVDHFQDALAADVAVVGPGGFGDLQGMVVEMADAGRNRATRIHDSPWTLCTGNAFRGRRVS